MSFHASKKALQTALRVLQRDFKKMARPRGLADTEVYEYVADALGGDEDPAMSPDAGVIDVLEFTASVTKALSQIVDEHEE